jgi:hypothetical protein
MECLIDVVSTSTYCRFGGLISIMKKLIVAAASLLFLVSACKSNLEPNRLYGKWKYTRVLNPKAIPPDSVKMMILDEQKPYIVFAKNNTVEIYWGGKVLSKGTFTTNGDNINVREQLPDGKTRQFPFYVSELDDKHIVFESMGEDGSKVTAIKQ